MLVGVRVKGAHSHREVISLFSEWTKMRKEVLGIVAAAAFCCSPAPLFAAGCIAKRPSAIGTQVAQAGKTMSGRARVRVKSAVLRARPDMKSHKVASPAPWHPASRWMESSGRLGRM